MHLKNIHFINLLFETLSVIENRNKKKFTKLIFLLLLQSILDVISIASIVPLIYILESGLNSGVNINEIMTSYKLSFLFSDENSVYIIIPIAIILIILIATFTRLFIIYKTNNFIEQTRHSLCTRLMEKFIINDYSFNIDTSTIAKSILSEVDQFIVIVFQPVMLMITNAILLIGIIFYLSITNLKASILSLILLGSFYMIFYLFTKKILNQQGLKSEKSNQGRFKTAMEAFKSIKDLKIYSAENYFVNRFSKNSKLFTNSNSLYSTLATSPKFVLEMMVIVTLSLTIMILAYNNQISKETIPLLGTFAFAAYKAQPALSNVMHGINSLEYGSKIINNLYFEIINYNRNKYHKNYEKNNSIKSSGIINKQKGLRINNLNFFYKNNAGFSNVSLFVEHPSIFLIAGKSGSGKSTLLNIISGLQKPKSGEINFNFKNGKRYKPNISFLHQDYYIYDTTIGENIAFGIKREDINPSLLNKVSKAAGIYNYIYNLENKFNEKVGENGNKLSIGQKQRIALARALYFEPDILLLDEPTSGLDKKNEEKIIKTIMDLSKKITIIMSTHKLNFFPKNLEIGFIEDNKLSIRKISEC